jgi:hypothetical protein
LLGGAIVRTRATITIDSMACTALG